MPFTCQVDIVAKQMHLRFVANVNELIIVQNNVKSWIGNYININLYIKRNEYNV